MNQISKRRENYLFIDNIPLLYPQENIVKQIQIELWLGMAITTEKEVLTPITNITGNKYKEKLEYVV